MKLKKIFLFATIYFLASSYSYSHDVELVIQSADWCSPCISLKNDLKKQGSINEIFLENGKTVLITWDDYSDFGKRVKENNGKINVVFPTFIIKKKGQEVSKINSINLESLTQLLEKYTTPVE